METRTSEARSAVGRKKSMRAAISKAVTPDTALTVAEVAARLATRAGGEPFVRLLMTRLEAIDGEVEREVEVLEAMLPPASVLSGAATTQLMWNAKARADALKEFGALNAAQIEEIRGVHTANPHATVSRWVKEGRLFAVDSADGRLFPGFQFSHGAPRTVIARVLAALAGQLHNWEILLWFTGPSGFLDGARPVDRLSDSPDAVVAAAAYQAALSED
jgi:hypothetical protein